MSPVTPLVQETKHAHSAPRQGRKTVIPIQGSNGCHRGINKVPQECKAETSSLCLKELANLQRWGDI